jgi:1-acyl-sn-glycerol-3-phosphate acyltransferase
VIAANKKPTVEWLLSRYIDWQLRRHFACIRSNGLEQLSQSVASAPTLIVANHTAWWDSMLFFHFAKIGIGMDAFAMMDAKNLRRIPILGKIGGFGVELGDKADGARAVTYAAQLLDRPRRAVIVFPQGRERPTSERPLSFLPGAARIAALAPRANIVACALRYEHRRRPKPEAFVALQRLADKQRSSEEMASVMTKLLDGIESALCDDSIDGWPTYLAHGTGLT